MNDIGEAVSILQRANIPSKETTYGFSLQHKEITDNNFAECGVEHDFSISMSVNIAEKPPVAWFFRLSFIEMAKFVVAAYKKTKEIEPSRSDIINSMRIIDEEYDDTELTKRTNSKI